MAFLALHIAATGAPKRFQDRALLSPDKKLAANIEWEDLGFVGLIRMKIYDSTGSFLRSAEVPEIDPEPANLLWIDNDWVASESFLGEKAGGFFYVDAHSGRGYLLEIVEPKPNSDWIFTIASNDPISTAPIANISRGKVSLFPVLLRDVPTNEAAFFTPSWVKELSNAVDTYNDFRHKNNIQKIDLLSDANVQDTLGALVVANINDRPEVIYFPIGAATPQEMLSRVRRQVLPESVHKLLQQPDAPELRAKWLSGGEYLLETVQEDAHPTAVQVLLRSKFEGVSDSPYVPPSAEKEKAATEAKKDEEKNKSKSSSKSDEGEEADKSDNKAAKKKSESGSKKPSVSGKDEKSSSKKSSKGKTRLDVKKPGKD